MRTFKFFLTAACGIAIASCASSPPPFQGYGPPAAQPGAGQYVYPQYLRPQPAARLNPDDTCNALLFVTLIGRHEGSIHFAGLPGRTRVIKPAFLEDDITGERIPGLDIETPFVEVRDFIGGQVLYGPSVGSPTRRASLGPDLQDRLTLELDEDGTVRDVSCR